MVNIVHVDTIDSTNNWCKAHADKLPVAVIAKEQSQGRGRYGRSFYSPAGSGVYMSYAFRGKYAADDVQLLTVVAAAAVHQVLQHHSSGDLAIKWVNDIYRNGYKIAGILCERVDLVNDPDNYYITIGVGVNVIPCEVPSELSDIIGFLYDDASLSPSTDEIAEELIAALDKALGAGSSDITSLTEYISYYRDRCFNIPGDCVII